MAKREVLIELFPKQEQFASALFSGKYNYLCYGGAIRGGKTVLVLSLIFILCRVFPGSRWAITRKDLPTIRRNLLPTFNKFKPRFVGSVHQTSWTATCENGSQIIFFPESIKDDPEGDRFRGLEVNGFVNEEANELQEQTFIRQQERMGTWTIPGLKVQPPKIILLTCNPSQGWVKDRFYNPWRTKTLEAPYFYLPAQADDNPYISEEQKEVWRKLPEAEYKRFVLGDWDFTDDPDQLIKFEWIHGAYETEEIGGRHKMGIDVARYGDDKTTFAYQIGNVLYEIEEFSQLSIDQTSNFAIARVAERSINADMVGVDTVGLGAGVADNMRAAGYRVKEIVSGGKPKEPDPKDEDPTASLYKFKDLRAQMWWHYREMLRKGELRLGVQHQKLVDDLLAPRYKIKSDRTLVVESKDDIKKRIGRSTDYGDAAVYAGFVDKLEEPHWLFNR